MVVSVWYYIFLWMGALRGNDTFSNTATYKQDGSIPARHASARCLFGRTGPPFIHASIFISFFSNFFKKINKHLNIISLISGVFLIILGILFLLDIMTKMLGHINSWVPFLSRISI